MAGAAASETVRTRQTENRQKPVGADRKFVDRMRYEHPERRIARPADTVRQEVFRKKTGHRFENVVAARLLRVFGGAAADHEKSGHRTVRYAKDFVEPV